MFKVIVAGSRSINDYALVERNLNQILKNKLSEDVCIFCGMAKGVDSLGEQYAINHKLYLKMFPANWDRYGNKAGFLRNVEMAEGADALVAFWDGKSRGTQHMINIAKKKDLQVRVVYV